MPLSLLPYPKFDPALISFGPFAIRWYALAYIVGRLLGWLYARTLIANDRYWSGPALLTATDLNDFVLWVTLGIILGGRTRYVLFYNFSHFIEHPVEIVQVWKKRHVVPRRLSRLRARGHAVRLEARHILPVARRPHLCGRAPGDLSRPPRQIS